MRLGGSLNERTVPEDDRGGGEGSDKRLIVRGILRMQVYFACTLQPPTCILHTAPPLARSRCLPVLVHEGKPTQPTHCKQKKKLFSAYGSWERDGGRAVSDSHWRINGRGAVV